MDAAERAGVPARCAAGITHTLHAYTVRRPCHPRLSLVCLCIARHARRAPPAGEWLPASVAPGGGDSLSPAAHVLLLFATARQLREAAGAAHLGAAAVASLCSGLAATPFDPKHPPPFVEPLLIPAKEEAEERSADVAAGLARSPPLGVWRHVPAGAEGRDRLASLRSLFPLQTHAAAKLASPRLVLLAPGTLKVLNNDAARALRNGFSPFPWLPRQAVDLDGDKRGWEGDPMAPGTSLLLILGKGLVASANVGEAKAALLAAAEAAAAVLDASPGPRLRVCVSSAADASQLGRAARRAARRGELGAEQHHAKNGEEQPGGAQVAPPTDDPDVVFVDLSREGGMSWAAPGVDALDPKARAPSFHCLHSHRFSHPFAGLIFQALAAAGQAFRSGQLPSPPRPCGLVASITLAAALSNPSAEDLSPTGTRHAGGLERLVQLALCPVACPLLCVARSCAQPPGCGLLAFLSGGSGSGAMYAAEAAGAGP